jgi:hypothetical protein
MILTEEVRIIKLILSEFFSEEFIDYVEEENIINFPAGLLIYEDNCWKLSWDYMYVNEPQDIIMVSTICKVLAEEEIDFDFDVYEGFYSIINDKDILVDCLWDSNIWYKVAEEEMSYQEAFDILKDEILNNDKKQELH